MALTLSEQLRGSMALGVLDRMADSDRELLPEEWDAIETLMEIVRRMADEAATPASDSANGPEQSGVGVAAQYREI